MAGTYYSTVYLTNSPTQNPFTLTPSGLVSVGNGDGIFGSQYYWTVINRGTVVSSGGNGIDLSSGGIVVNGQSGSAGGLISGIRFGVEITGGAGVITNYGTISAGAGEADSGVIIEDGGTVTNSGMITGRYGVEIVGGGTVNNSGTIIGTDDNGVDVLGSGAVTNTGTITGSAAVYSKDTLTVTNYGAIRGSSLGIELSAGSVVNSGCGAVTGGISQRFGGVQNLAVTNAGLITGATGVYANSIVNTGTIIGTSGFGVRLDGSGAALCNSGVITGTVAFGSGAETVTNYGMISGSTAVSFGSGADVLVLGTQSSTGRLAGFGSLDTIDLAKVQATGATFANGMLSVLNGTVTVDTLLLSGTFTNSFVVLPDGHGGSDIALRVQPPGKTLRGSFYQTVYLTNYGTQNPFTVKSSGLVSVTRGDAVVGTAGYQWALFNQGTVESASGDGIDLTAGGSVTNGQSGSSGGLISGYRVGVEIDQKPGTVTNYGRIAATGTGPTAGVYLAAGGTVSNSGTIAGAVGVSVGANHSGSATIFNYGTIIGTGGTAISLGSLGTYQLIVLGTSSSLTGDIAIAGTSSTLQIDGTVMPENVISGLAPGDTIDLANVAFDSATAATIFQVGVEPSDNFVLHIVEGGASYDLQLNSSQFAGGFAVAADQSGSGTDITVTSGAVTNYFASATISNGTSAVSPYLGVCQITDSLGSATGFIIGPHTVLTAAHVVDPSGAPVATDITVYPGTTSSGTGARYEGTAALNDAYYVSDPLDPGIEQDDFAVIYCPTADFPASATFSLEADYRGGTVNLTGYPATVNGVPSNSPGAAQTTQFTETGSVTVDPTYQLLDDSSDLSTVHGDSGSPLWIYDGSSLEAVGIVVTTNLAENTLAYGVQLTDADLAQITDWENSFTPIAAGQTASNATVTSGNSLDVLGAAENTIIDSGGAENVYGSDSDAIVNDGGYQYILSGGTATGAVVDDPGIEIVASGGTASGAILSGGEQEVYLGGVAIGTTISSGGREVISSGGVVSGGIVFGGSGGELLIAGAAMPATMISGFTAFGDAIDLTGLAFSGNTSVGFNAATDVLTVTEGGNSATVQLDTGESYTGVNWAAQSDDGGGTDITVACFCRGTLIRTETGEVAVEALAIGDGLVTVSGAVRRIKWIGRRSYDGRFAATNPAVLPICIGVGAIAEGLPARDLLVSPEHALHIDGALVPARLLSNGATIRQVASLDRLEYFHIELDGHDIIYAEGMPAETFVDCDNRAMFQNAGEFAALYPDDRSTPWDFCAPRLEPGSAELTAIRAALLVRAEALGYGFSDNPDLHLVVDGEIERARSVVEEVYSFTIPAGSGAIWLASRSAVSAEVEPTSQDRRRLGVPLRRIVLHAGDLRSEIGCGHASLCEGFHEDEGRHRWTDGRARLPDELLCLFAGEVTVELHISKPGRRYPLNASAAAASPAAGRALLSRLG